MITPKITNLGYSNLWSDVSTILDGGAAPTPSTVDEMYFTTIAGSVDYVGNQGDQILLSNGTIIDVDVTKDLITFNVPSGKHKVILVESIDRNNYVGFGGEALIELHKFPELSTITTFDFCPNVGSSNLVKVPTILPSNLTNISWLFYGATSFNQDISMWNTSNVTNMTQMFYNAIEFNQDISNWDTSNVTDMISMFQGTTSFNQDISNWDVSNVTNMNSMFYDAIAFNQPLNSWNVSNVTNMNSMFTVATSFNQDISNWCVSNITSEPSDFSINSPLTEPNKPVWGTCPRGENVLTTQREDNATVGVEKELAKQVGITL